MQFIVSKIFQDNQKEYFLRLSSKEQKQFLSTKETFKENIFHASLGTHTISEVLTRKGLVKILSASINGKDRIIFFFLKPDKVYLYKIIDDHDYKKLLAHIKSIIHVIVEIFP